MLYKVFDFADKEVSDVMVPRPEVVALSVDLPPEEALRAVIDSPYTRYPVYRESLDDIVGVLHVRDLFSALHDRGIARGRARGRSCGRRTSSRRRRTSRRCSTEFRRTNQHMAIVVDEYGDDGGHRHARGPARGDRRRDRGRVRPARRVGRADRRDDASGSTARSRSTTSTSSSARELAASRTTTRWPASSSACSAGRPRPATRSRTDGLRFTVLEVEGSRIERLEVEFGVEPEPEPEAEAEEPQAAEG